MPKIKCRTYLDDLQNFTNGAVALTEIARNFILGGISKQQDVKKLANSLSNRIYNDGYFSDDEVKVLDKVYKSNEILIPQDNIQTVKLDYYPDVFGSCGTGYFVSSEQKEQIQVPVNALFKSLSKGKKYSVINAKGNSMSPYIHSGDKLIVEHLDNQPIIDNHVYIFCYDNDLYIKRLYKNIDEIIAKSDNPDPIFKVKSIPKSQWNNLQLIGEIVGLMRELK